MIGELREIRNDTDANGLSVIFDGMLVDNSSKAYEAKGFFMKSWIYTVILMCNLERLYVSVEMFPSTDHPK